MSRLWSAAASEISLHGFSYLGVLLTFVGILGFLLFAFRDVPTDAQPFVELFIALVFFGWAWALRRQDAKHAASGMELVGGMVLPLVAFAGFVDGAPFPPDFHGGGLVIALTVTSVLMAGGYAWYSAKRAGSTLRYLVAPLLWLGALTLGFAFKTDEFLAGDAITRLVPPQPALAAAGIALTLVACHRRREHRLALPSVRAAWVGLPVAYLLTIALSVGEGWVRIWPILLLSVSTLVSAEVLMAWYRKQSWAMLVRPFLFAAVLALLTPSLGVGWSGLMVAVAYVALLEWDRRASPAPRRVLLLTVAGILAGAGMALTEPWPALTTFTFLALWAHVRRVGTWGTREVGQAFLAAAVVFPFGIGYGLVQILGAATAVLVMAGALAAITATVRWRGSEDVFWPAWLTGTAAVVAGGALTVWSTGDRSDMLAAVAVLTIAGTVGFAPRWPIPRLWAAAGLVSAGLAMVLETAGLPVERRIIVWAGLGLVLVVVAGALRRPRTSHLAAIGHIVGTLTLLVLPAGTAGAATLGAWTLAWIASAAAQEGGGDSFTALLSRVPASAGWVRWVVPIVMVAGIPPTALAVANLSPAFVAHRPWTGILMATISLAYALAARLTIARKPLSTVLSFGAVASSIIGVAVAAPGAWPTIFAAAAVIGVASLLTGDLRRSWFVWFAWFMSVVMVLLLGARAGVPAASLHLVSLVWGGVMMFGGLVADEIKGGRRGRGEGLRIRSLRYPVLLGALVVPISLGAALASPPATYRWWALGASVAYFGAAYLIRAGAVTAPAFGLLALGLTAMSPRSLLDEPWLFIFIAAPMVGASWAFDRLQSEDAASDDWLRWDLPALLVAHLVGVFALVTAVGTDRILSTALAFGLLAPAIGVWRRHRGWVDAGNLLILIAAFEAGMGWLALALVATAVRGAIGAWRSQGLSRASYHAIAVVSAALAWLAFIDWSGLSPTGAVNSSALVFGSLGLAVTIVASVNAIRTDTAAVWGGLAVAGLVVAGWSAAVPGGPGIVGPFLAIGILLMSAAFELAAKRVRPTVHVLSLVSVVGAGLAWLALVPGVGWGRSDAVVYSVLVFGGVALVAGVLARGWGLGRVDVVRWGGLGVVGVLWAGAASLGELGVTVEGPWVAVGVLMVAVFFELAWRTVDPSLRYVAAGSAGLAWLALVPGVGWSRPFAVGVTVVVFGALMIGVVEQVRFRLIRRDDMTDPTGLDLTGARAWAGLGALGVAASLIVADGTVDLPRTSLWVAGGLALLAVGAGRAAEPLGFGWLREASVVAGFFSLTRIQVDLSWSQAWYAAGILALAASATFASLALWRRVPGSVWVRPLAILAALANAQAVWLGLEALPDGILAAAVLVSIGVQVLAVGFMRNSARILAAGPPLVGLSFVLAAAGSVSGTAQWYTVPAALVLLSEVEILRKLRRESGLEAAQTDALVLEWAGIGLLAAPPLVEMFTTGLGYGLVAFGVAVAVFLWAVVTRVIRRAVAAACLAVVAAVLLVVAAAAGAAPDTAFFWIVAAGIGFAVMLVAALVEAYRSRKGRAMTRLNELMEGWE
jgi:hypothetical protein